MLEAETRAMVAAGERQGLVTRKEALARLSAKVIRRRLAIGAWVAVLPNVYRVAGAPVIWRQHLEALQLWARKRFAFSHRTAAALLGFESFEEGALELSVTRRMRIPRGVRVFRVEVLPHNELTEIDGLIVTNATRTLIDLAAQTDSLTLRSAFDQALRKKLTTLEKLERAAARSQNRAGVIDVRALLRELSGADGPSESELEDLALELLHAAGLPRPRVQWSLIAGSKRRRLDLLFELHGVVIEADGYAYHSGIDSFEDDRGRNNALIARGFRVLHWTWRALNDTPEQLIADLYAALNLPR